MANRVHVAGALLALGAALLWVIESRGGSILRADPSSIELDADGDFLPDIVEWAVLTSPHNADSDQDGIPDFVEVVQHGNPRMLGQPRPADHEMRLVVTSVPGAGGALTHLHLLFRFMGEVSLLSSFDPWIHVDSLPGVRLPLGSLATGGMTFAQRMDPSEGLWLRISVPLASETVLRALLPCTIGATGVIGTRRIETAVPLFDMRGHTATMVNYAPGLFAVQTISPAAAFAGGGSNRVCVLQLREVGRGPGGAAYQVANAGCDDCNDLECGPMCPETVGWVFILPGGVEAITGG